MPTVIDSFFVELGLDPKAFFSGMKAATEQSKRTKEQLGSDAKEIEARNKADAESFGSMKKELAGFLALLVGASTVKSFITNIVGSDAAVGQLARTINMSGRDLAQWRSAAELAGGSADEMSNSLQWLTKQLQQFALTGESQVIGVFRSLGISVTDNNRHLKTAAQLYKEFAKATQGMDPARAAEFASMLNIDPKLGARGLGTLQRFLDEAAKLGLPNDADQNAAIKLRHDFVALRLEATDLGRKILTEVSPPILEAMRGMGAWVANNREWINQNISEEIRKFTAYLQGLDWKSIGKGINEFVTDANSAAGAVGGWSRVIEGMFLLWTGGQFAKVLANIRLLRGTLWGPLGLLGMLGYLGWNALGDSDAHKERTGHGRSSAPGVNPWTEEKKEEQEHPGESGIGRAWRKVKEWWSGSKKAYDKEQGGNKVSDYPQSSGEGNLTALINAEAARAGIDPMVMQGIRAGESGHGRNYDKKDDALESSWGPFQLNRRSGLGVEFERDTAQARAAAGLGDLRDPRTIPMQVRWVAEYIKSGRSLRPWAGYKGTDPEVWRRLGKGDWHKWGDSGYVPAPAASKAQPMRRAPPGIGDGSKPPIPPQAPPAWAGGLSAMPQAAAFTRIGFGPRTAAGATSMDNRRYDQTHETHIGEVHVHTKLQTRPASPRI